MAELDSAASGKALVSGTGEDQWKVSSRTFSYKDGQITTLFHRSIELEEQERLSLERVEFRGLALVPEPWVFESDGDGAVHFRVLLELSTEDSAQFEQVLDEHVTGSGRLAFLSPASASGTGRRLCVSESASGSRKATMSAISSCLCPSRATAEVVEAEEVYRRFVI